MAEKITARGVPPDRIRVIQNWCDDQQIIPVAHANNPLRCEWGLEDKFVVGYSGNLGRAHEFKTVLDASERLRENPRIIFMFIGGGHLREELVQAVKQRGVDRQFRFFPYQKQEMLSSSLSAADIHWLSLRPELEGLIVPSKFYGIAAAGRPMIAITAPDGEIAQVVAQHECGLVIPPGNADALASALMALSADPKRVAQLGRNARAMLQARFTCQHALDRWQRVLENIA
jgi:colanic acid biosynthesis glycosyl transferase WcaI